MQAWGHEIGWHNDLLTMLAKGHPDIRKYFHDEYFFWVRQGIIMRGTASHGSGTARQCRFLNYYVWEEWDAQFETHPSFTEIPIDDKLLYIPKIKMKDYFDYEAYASPHRYISDANRKKGIDYKLFTEDSEIGEQVQIAIHPNQINLKRKYLWWTPLN